MLHINKLQDLHLISGFFQSSCPECVRHKCSDPLLDQTIFQNWFQNLIFHLFIQFMLTARHRQDYFCIPFQSLLQGIICGRITGVQRHNHVHFGNALVICNISGQKSQFIIAVFFRKGIAACDHIFFQIQSDHTDIIAI